jgi:hypothetical protein
MKDFLVNKVQRAVNLYLFMVAPFWMKQEKLQFFWVRKKEGWLREKEVVKERKRV